MSIVRCERCDRYIDLDYDCEVFSKEEIPILDVKGCDMVCFGCLSEEEANALDSICPECGEQRADDVRVKHGMKCGFCAYGKGEDDGK